jgi:hypothetical protein
VTPRRILPTTTTGRLRLLVLLVAGIAMVLKLRLAATTIGTNDVITWEGFAQAVGRVGPINIYALHFATPYNHPPLIGWFLVLINHLAHHGFTIPYLIRAPAIVADLFTALLVFELLRSRRRVGEAAFAGILVAMSPVLFTVSGFHGNTDPVFIMFLLLAAYLLADRDKPLLSGVSFAIAIGIKLVPVVALPAFLVAAARSGRKRLSRFILGAAAGVLPFWVPVLLRQRQGFTAHVLEYAGSNPRRTQWGLVDFARHLHAMQAVDFLAGPGRYIVLALCAIVPAVFCLRRKDVLVESVGLSLAMFLLLTPAFGVQYLSWVVAGLYLLNIRAATAFNLIAGGLLVQTYTRWSGGFPWYRGVAHEFNRFEEKLGWVTWAALLVAVLWGIRKLLHSRDGSAALNETSRQLEFDPEPSLP